MQLFWRDFGVGWNGSTRLAFDRIWVERPGGNLCQSPRVGPERRVYRGHRPGFPPVFMSAVAANGPEVYLQFRQ